MSAASIGEFTQVNDMIRDQTDQTSKSAASKLLGFASSPQHKPGDLLWKSDECCHVHSKLLWQRNGKMCWKSLLHMIKHTDTFGNVSAQTNAATSGSLETLCHLCTLKNSLVKANSDTQLRGWTSRSSTSTLVPLLNSRRFCDKLKLEVWRMLQCRVRIKWCRRGDAPPVYFQHLMAWRQDLTWESSIAVLRVNVTNGSFGCAKIMVRRIDDWNSDLWPLVSRIAIAIQSTLQQVRNPRLVIVLFLVLQSVG